MKILPESARKETHISHLYTMPTMTSIQSSEEEKTTMMNTYDENATERDNISLHSLLLFRFFYNVVSLFCLFVCCALHEIQQYVCEEQK